MSSYTPAQLRAAIDRLGDRLSPAQREAFLRATRRLTDPWTLDEMVRRIAARDVDGAVALVFEGAPSRHAFSELEAAVRGLVTDSAATLAVGFPRLAKPGGAAVRIAFNVAHPATARAIDAYAFETMATVEGEMRDGLRAYVTRGLAEGVNPRVIGTALKRDNVIGLSAYDVAVVENTRLKLLSNDPAYFTLRLRNKRLDKRIRKAMASDAGVPDALVEQATADYENNRLGFRAEMHARTAALDAARLAQRSMWQQAIDDGSVNAHDLEREWFTTLDGRERRSHHAMHRVKTTWDKPFVGPRGTPAAGHVWEFVGENEYGCRCVEFTRVSLAALQRRARAAIEAHRATQGARDVVRDAASDVAARAAARGATTSEPPSTVPVTPPSRVPSPVAVAHELRARGFTPQTGTHVGASTSTQPPPVVRIRPSNVVAARVERPHETVRRLLAALPLPKKLRRP